MYRSTLRACRVWSAPDNLIEKDARLVIRASGTTLTPDDVRELRRADQR